MSLQPRVRRTGRFLVSLFVLSTSLACSGWLFAPPEEALVQQGHGALQSGDLPTAKAAFLEAFETNEQSVPAATGHAYIQLLSGDLEGADRTLGMVEPYAGDQVGEIRLRRALVALRSGDLDKVREHGAASGLPEGLLLAAEVHLTELESDKATELLSQVQGAEGVVGATADKYLRMINSGDPNLASLADATALWALGDRQGACKTAEELVKELPQGDARNIQLLLWAGRSVTSGLPSVSRSLLDEMTAPPQGQEWRVQATYGMVDIAENRVKSGLKRFAALRSEVQSGAVPADGLADAVATACGLASNVEDARELVKGMESVAVARCLMEAGDPGAALQQAPPGSLKNFLESQ